MKKIVISLLIIGLLLSSWVGYQLYAGSTTLSDSVREAYSLLVRPNAANPTLTENGNSPLSVDLNGRLRVGGQVSDSINNITTNTSTVVKASFGVVNKVHINVVGTTSNVRLFNDATAPCDTNFVLQIDTTSLTNNSWGVYHEFATGICALTAGAAAADISVLFR
jgi:uncharacterized alkaline shock family protein YloU